MPNRTLAEALAPSRLRLIIVGVAMILIWVALGYRLVQVQVVKADSYAERGLSQRQENRTLSPSRGRIFDRHGAPLAITVEAKSIYAVPDQVDDPLMTAQQVALITGGNVGKLVEQLEGGSNFVYLARQTELDKAQLVENLELRGVYSHPDSKRVYPAEDSAAYVVGLANVDGEGIEGLEFQYEQELRGTPGTLILEEDPSGRMIPLAPNRVIPAVPGQDLYTSLDLSLQYTAEQACQDTLEHTSARSCWAVVLEVETGRIVALAGVPSFNPVTRQRSDGGGFTNFAIRGTFEPGSTQKLITLAAALDTRQVSADTQFFYITDTMETIYGACEDPDDDIYGCFQDFSPHPPHDLTVQEIFAESSNIGTIKVSQQLERGVLEEYIGRFGEGQLTGVDYSGEATGAIRLDPGCSSCLPSVAIGYSVSVTPLQLASAYAAVGNNGAWVQPHLVTSIVDVDGNRSLIKGEERKVINPRTAQVMRRMLLQVVREGTGQLAQVPGYLVGGKTGTAYKYGTTGYTNDIMASFVGMAPIDDPKLTVAVVVDSPVFPYNTGGQAAAPAFAEIMEAALHRQGVAPDARVG